MSDSINHENAGSFRALDDVDLVVLIRDSESIAERESAGTVLVERYYESFDRRIRTVLASRGLDYSPSSEYYNNLFFDVFQRSFTTSALRKKLKTFDTGKGDFAGWFLGAVVVNEVKDWLKKRSDRAGMAMSELLVEEAWAWESAPDEFIEQLGDRTTTCHAEAPIDTEGNSLELSRELQIVAELASIAYSFPSDQTIQEIADIRGEAVDKVTGDLASIRDKLRISDKFREYNLTDLRLAIEQERIRHYEVLVGRTGSNLRNLGLPEKDLADIEKTSRRPWKEIRNDLKAARQTARSKQIDTLTYNTLRLRYEYETYLKRLEEHRAKLREIREMLSSGKTMVRMPNKDIAGLLKIPEGTVASRINAIKKHLPKDQEKSRKNSRRIDPESA